MGNSGRPSDDYRYMDCGEVRVALSALLDDETPPVPVAQVRRHVQGCGGCRQWQTRAQQLNRSVRMQVAADVPDLTERVLTAVGRDTGAGRVGGRPAPALPRRPRLALRIGVAAAALVQLAFALPGLLPLDGYGSHAGREGAAFDIAIAVGFLLAARYPRRAGALVPVAVVLAGALAVTSGIDLAGGATTLLHELGHVLAIVQAGLLWRLGRGGGEPAPTVARPVAA